MYVVETIQSKTDPGGLPTAVCANHSYKNNVCDQFQFFHKIKIP